MKPGNPPATLQEGCKFRRTMYDMRIIYVSQDEGESYDAIAPESQGFFVVYGI